MRILPHLDPSLENELTNAVEQSMDGNGEPLGDLCDLYPGMITDDDIGAIRDELRIARCDGADAAVHDDSDYYFLRVPEYPDMLEFER